MKHTPTPWHCWENASPISIGGHDYTQITIENSEHGDYVAYCFAFHEETLANIEHAVKCVNAHNELVEALAGLVKIGPEFCFQRPPAKEFDACYAKARAVLEKVKQ